MILKKNQIELLKKKKTAKTNSKKKKTNLIPLFGIITCLCCFSINTISLWIFKQTNIILKNTENNYKNNLPVRMDENHLVCHQTQSHQHPWLASHTTTINKTYCKHTHIYMIDTTTTHWESFDIFRRHRRHTRHSYHIHAARERRGPHKRTPANIKQSLELYRYWHRNWQRCDDYHALIHISASSNAPPGDTRIDRRTRRPMAPSQSTFFSDGFQLIFAKLI